MRRKLIRWELMGFLITVAAGTLLHFLYEWSGGSKAAAAFCAVNESTWEHMKLLFIPLFFFSLVQVIFLWKTYPNLPAARGLSAIVGTALIPVLFYTYTGVWGNHAMWADIAVFVLSAAAAFLLDHALLRRGRLSSPFLQLLGVIVLWGLLFVFIFFTFRPPHLAVFQDPVTLQYGIAKP
ncbi:hypothetical protein KQI82_14405 [Oscillibacter sp. MSJ-2]|uniref:Uncharacterized protein n=1 Tax=Dysosmobacter acutus TaxID=2841504 RepID=A0ABS6FCW2_9FIRM|nr:DUF6512 family protein [Dysosmobacter acutus]MBU5628101.1 hypothetical protein [Dysosmobacter acutus]